MKLTPQQRWRWFCAVACAGWYGSSHMPLLALLRSVRAVWHAAFCDHGEEVGEKLYQARMAHCRDCAVYQKDRETCGFTKSTTGMTLGCGCYMPALSRLKSGHCWLREKLPFSDMGWPDELL